MIENPTGNCGYTSKTEEGAKACYYREPPRPLPGFVEGVDPKSKLPPRMFKSPPQSRGKRIGRVVIDVGSAPYS